MNASSIRNNDLSRRSHRRHARHASDYIVAETMAVTLIGFAMMIGMKLIN
jgi:hypothetical protein